MPTLSVIMAVRDAARHLRDAIDSVLAQTLAPTEILLIDGQSQDETAVIARSYPEITYVRQPDLGLANARNLGLRQAVGDMVAFLDGDDLWPADKLLRQAGQIETIPGALYSIGWMRLFTVDGHAPPSRYSPDAFGRGQPGYTPGALVARRELFAEIGPFDATLRLACDSDWFARLLDSALPAANVAEVVLHKRIHDGNASHQLALYREEMARVMHASVRRKQSRGSG